MRTMRSVSVVCQIARIEPKLFSTSIAANLRRRGPWLSSKLAEVSPTGETVIAPPETLSLGPGFRLAARWNRLVETVKARKKREKTGGKWARYGLKGVKGSGSPGGG